MSSTVFAKMPRSGKNLGLREFGPKMIPERQRNLDAICKRSRMKLESRDYCASLSAADISFELFDDKLLFSDDGFNEIADGNHTTHFACFDNR